MPPVPDATGSHDATAAKALNAMAARFWTAIAGYPGARSSRTPATAYPRQAEPAIRKIQTSVPASPKRDANVNGATSGRRPNTPADSVASPMMTRLDLVQSGPGDDRRALVPAEPVRGQHRERRRGDEHDEDDPVAVAADDRPEAAHGRGGGERQGCGHGDPQVRPAPPAHERDEGGDEVAGGRGAGERDR